MNTKEKQEAKPPSSSHSTQAAPDLPALQRVTRTLAEQPDVHRVLDCAPLPNGRVRYLIETPYESFPRFAVGTCDLDLEGVEIELTCGLEISARDFFESQIDGKASSSILNSMDSKEPTGYQ